MEICNYCNNNTRLAIYLLYGIADVKYTGKTVNNIMCLGINNSEDSIMHRLSYKA